MEESDERPPAGGRRKKPEQCKAINNTAGSLSPTAEMMRPDTHLQVCSLLPSQPLLKVKADLYRDLQFGVLKLFSYLTVVKHSMFSSCQSL